MLLIKFVKKVFKEMKRNANYTFGNIFNIIKPVFKLNYEKVSSEIFKFIWPSVISKLRNPFYSLLLWNGTQFFNLLLQQIEWWLFSNIEFFPSFQSILHSFFPNKYSHIFFYYFQHEINGYSRYIAHTHLAACVRKCCREKCFP